MQGETKENCGGSAPLDGYCKCWIGRRSWKCQCNHSHINNPRSHLALELHVRFLSRPCDAVTDRHTDHFECLGQWTKTESSNCQACFIRFLKNWWETDLTSWLRGGVRESPGLSACSPLELRRSRNLRRITLAEKGRVIPTGRGRIRGHRKAQYRGNGRNGSRLASA